MTTYEVELVLEDEMKIRCGITMGDPAGIGAEIILKALVRPSIRKLADFVVIGDRRILEEVWRIENRKGKLAGFKVIDLKNVSEKGFKFGKLRSANGKVALEYLDTAIDLINHKHIDCLVTAPVNKEAITSSGCHFTGQTEYLARHFKIQNAVMMLLNKKLKVALAPRHIPLKDVPAHITIDGLVKVITGCAQGLYSFFGMRNPRLAVCGLNPHASDNGVIGKEEARVLIPAIKKARRQRISVSGPFAADTIFEKAVQGKYDCVVCMYHDQGLIPLKLTGFNQAVNITLGLPFVRTSPGHGTAYDIAGKNKANPESLIQAIKIALQCTRNQRKA